MVMGAAIDIERRVRGYQLVAYSFPEGSCAAYYPETNPLVALDAEVVCHDPRCLTQAIRVIYESRAIQVYPNLPGRRYVLETD